LKNEENITNKTLISILETLIINIIVYLIFYSSQANQEVYLFLNPHPLLILTIIIALIYGMRRACISALISSIFYIAVFLKTNGDILIFLSYFKYYKYPLFFLWMAILIGAFKDNHDKELEKINEEIEIIKNDNLLLENDVNLLNKIQNELKKQIISSNESIMSLYDIATKLESFEIEDIYTETVGILKKYLRATSVSLYTVDYENMYLRLKISYGEPQERQLSIDAKNCSWFIKIQEEKRVIKHALFEENNKDLPLMSAPLIKNNQIIAIVNIRDMEFDSVSEYAFTLFQLIVDWINRALEQATYVEELEGNKYLEDTNLVKANYFKKRIEIEQRRKKEFGMDYCLFSYRVKDLSLEEINNTVKNTLRGVDLAYYNITSNSLTFLLPATKQENSYYIQEKIIKNFDNKLEAIELKPVEV
jgi:hypothetical protein